jgi:thiol-disulfide isomerase/thioredoxin
MNGVSATEERQEPTAFPRWLAGIVIGAIALASVVSLAWPWLASDQPKPGAVIEVNTVYAQIEEPGAAGRISAVAPNFAWYDSDGKSVSLSDFRGKIVVITFWATWCVPCRTELPALNRVVAADPTVVVLAVDVKEYGNRVERIQSFFDQYALDHLIPVLDLDIGTSTRYGILSVPTTFFVDKDGVIRHLEIGVGTRALTDDQIKRGIAKAR